jgi:hypothetical protein
VQEVIWAAKFAESVSARLRLVYDSCTLDFGSDRWNSVTCRIPDASFDGKADDW